MSRQESNEYVCSGDSEDKNCRLIGMADYLGEKFCALSCWLYFFSANMEREKNRKNNYNESTEVRTLGVIRMQL